MLTVNIIHKLMTVVGLMQFYKNLLSQYIWISDYFSQAINWFLHNKVTMYYKYCNYDEFNFAALIIVQKN